jgi:hypothetical protein
MADDSYDRAWREQDERRKKAKAEAAAARAAAAKAEAPPAVGHTKVDDDYAGSLGKDITKDIGKDLKRRRSQR